LNQYKKIKFSSQLINLLIKSLPFIHSEWGGGASLEGAFGPLQAHTPTPYPLWPLKHCNQVRRDYLYSDIRIQRKIQNFMIWVYICWDYFRI